MQLSINKLSELTGRDRRTIKKRLVHLEAGKDGYLSADALQAIYIDYDMEEGSLDPAKESAKLNKARREKCELETAVLRGELCNTEDIESLWVTLVTNAKTKLLSLPQKCAHQVLAAEDYAEAEKILSDIVHEALSELSSDNT